MSAIEFHPADLTLLASIQVNLEALRCMGEDYLIVAVGVRGPNYDCEDGNAVATVRMGDDEATSEALRLPDAISLARGKILRKREARRKQREAEKAKAKEQSA